MPITLKVVNIEDVLWSSSLSRKLKSSRSSVRATSPKFQDHRDHNSVTFIPSPINHYYDHEFANWSLVEDRHSQIRLPRFTLLRKEQASCGRDLLHRTPSPPAYHLPTIPYHIIYLIHHKTIQHALRITEPTASRRPTPQLWPDPLHRIHDVERSLGHFRFALTNCGRALRIHGARIPKRRSTVSVE